MARIPAWGAVVAVTAAGWWATAPAAPEREPLRGEGLLRAEVSLELRALVQGPVRSVLRREGDAIVGAEPVVVLDAAEAELQLALARCDLEVAELAARKVRDGARPEDIERARAFYHESKAGLELAERTLRSDIELHAAGMLSDLARQRSERTVDAARALAESRRLDLAILEKGARPEDLRLAEIETERRRVLLAQREREVARSRIGGPREGRAFVTRIHVDEGAWVKAGDPVADVAYMDRLRVDIAFPATEALDLRAGATATVRSPVVPGATLAARVVGVSPVVDAATGTVHVVILAENPDLTLRPGVPATVEIRR